MKLKSHYAAWRNRVDRTLDRLPVGIITQPLEMALGLALLVNALRGLLFGQLTPSLVGLPLITQLTYLLVSLIGGVGLSVGLCMSLRPERQPVNAPIPVGTAVERASLFLVAGSYGGLGLAVLANNFHRGVGTAVVYLIIVAGLLIRTWAIRRTTKAVIATTLRQANGE